jgi:hypothetical protein
MKRIRELHMFSDARMCIRKNARDRALFRGQSGGKFGNHGRPANAESICSADRCHRPICWTVTSAAALLI